MTKYGRRESVESSSGSHMDPGTHEQLKGTKMEIEDKVTKILKLIKNEDQDGKEWNPEENSKKESELVEFIEDFHEQYQSLYALYDHLKGARRQKVYGRKEKEDSSSSTSSSDSEYYSSEEVGTNNDKLTSPRKKVVDSIKEELAAANFEVTDLKHKLASTSEEKEALDLAYKAALSETQESKKIINDMMIEAEKRQSIIEKLMDESGQLKKKLGEREREVVSSAEMHEVHERKTSAKTMEDRLTALKLEVESLCSQKRELEEQIESKAFETKQLGEENLGLQAKILKLEMISKEKGEEAEELSGVVKNLEDKENNSMSKIEDLMAQVNNLQLEVDSLRTQRVKLEKGMVCKRNQINEMQQELESLKSQKTESESQVESNTRESIRDVIQVEALKEDLERRTVDQQRMLEENGGLVVRVKDLERELDSLHKRNSDLEEHIRIKSHETGQLREEINGKQYRIFELEKTLTERGDEFSALQNLKDRDNEVPTQSTALIAQVDRLQQEVESLQTQKSQLEMQINREKQESLESLIQLENQNIKLTSTIAGQQRILKEKEDTISKLSKDYEQLKRGFRESKLNLQIAERKMEALAEEFRLNIEDNIRLLYQRIRVIEQLHVENKENYRTAKAWFEQEHRILEEMIDEYPGIIANRGAELRKMKDTWETTNNTLTGLDSVVRKFEDSNGNFMSRISKFTNELRFAKNWVTGTKKVNELLKEEVNNLVGQLQDEEKQEAWLREKVLKLEMQVTEEGGEKLNLMKTVSQLEKTVEELEMLLKEKDEGMLNLGEEKREAIRQLCVGIDYHRSRCNHLKEFISKKTVRSRRTA